MIDRPLLSSPLLSSPLLSSPLLSSFSQSAKLVELSGQMLWCISLYWLPNSCQCSACVCVWLMLRLAPVSRQASDSQLSGLVNYNHTSSQSICAPVGLKPHENSAMMKMEENCHHFSKIKTHFSATSAYVPSESFLLVMVWGFQVHSCTGFFSCKLAFFCVPLQ